MISSFFEGFYRCNQPSISITSISVTISNWGENKNLNKNVHTYKSNICRVSE